MPGTRIALASLYWLIPIGIKNSSFKIYPGWIGGILFIFLPPLMIIHYFHIKGIVSIPFKANSPLIVDPDTVLAFSVSGQ
jgi:hypothetical protein